MKTKRMTATGIQIKELLKILDRIQKTGIDVVDITVKPGDEFPDVNKVVIYPVRETAGPSSEIKIFDPKVRTDNNDIFDLLNDSL